MSLEEKMSNNPNINSLDENNKASPELNIPEVQEKKTYINMYCCNISIGIIITYVFIFCSISTNIINRLVFFKYEFNFEIFLLFLQEIFNIIFYILASNKSEVFRSLSGEISLAEFYKLKYHYIGYSIFFILQAIMALLGYQLIKNIPMYVNLRKFVTVMTFAYQYFFKKKKIKKIDIIVIIFLTIGAIFAGLDDFDTDIIGYLIIFCKNILNVVDLEISENFKKKHGVSNVKLLAYKSFISPPFLLIIMYLYNENNELIKYFKSEHDFSYLSLFACLFLNLLFIFIANLSFFISNEKNNSLFTQLLSDAKYIFVTLLSYFILKTFIFTWKNILGLFLSTIGAIIITISSMYDNIQLKKNKVKSDNIKIIELSHLNEKGLNINNKNMKSKNSTNVNETYNKNNDIDNMSISAKTTELENYDNNNNISIDDIISNSCLNNISEDNIINIIENRDDLNKQKKEYINDSNNTIHGNNGGN